MHWAWEHQWTKQPSYFGGSANSPPAHRGEQRKEVCKLHNVLGKKKVVEIRKIRKTGHGRVAGQEAK